MSYTAVDIHVHPSTSEYLVDAMGPFREATEAHFRTQIPVRTVPEMADEFRADNVLAVLFAWDATSASGLPPVTNDFVAGCVADHPDAFLGFASVDPWQGRAAVAELRRALVDLGLRGLKLHPSAQDFDPDDRRFYDLYAVCAELEVPVLFHTGTTGLGAGLPGGGGIKLGRSRPILLDNVAADFPELQIVAAHPSYPWQDEMLAVAQHKTNVWLDLSGWSPRLWAPALRDAVLGPLSDRALFGTDYPFITFAQWHKAFLRHEPSDEVVAKVLRGNAARLLGLDLGEPGAPGAPGAAGAPGAPGGQARP
ncbi:MAG TPA: amidohydrolase family protein [Acidimicrobiales bacterium]|nr:amidohydrolase family protein [Acidimicrobiales bacterium]